MRKLRTGILALAAASALLLTACAPAGSAEGGEADGDVVTLKVAAVTSPMTDIVEAAGEAIADGYRIDLVEVADYVTANTMLAAGDVFANFSQHIPYMQSFNEGNDAELTPIQPVYNFVIAFYSKTIDDIADLPDGATIAIPDDSSNRGRALKMLHDAGIIALDPAVDPYVSKVSDIAENPKNIEFLEVGISVLNAAYDEADLVFQWPSHIAALGLNPHDDGLLTELDDQFALFVAVQNPEADPDSVQALKDAFASDAVRAIIEENGTIEAAF